MPKSDRITIRLDADMGARLSAKASALGLDDAAYARMLIYRDVNEIPLPEAGQWPGREMLPLMTEAKVGTSAPTAEEQPEPLPVEEMDIPADPDDGAGLDDLLRAGPSLLDQMMAQTAAAPAPTNQRPGAALQQRTYRAPLANRNRGLQPVYGPGSMTRAIGVNDMAIGANNTGDGRGNVLRDNMRHFGITGTRSR